VLTGHFVLNWPKPI
jgi:hypothetical protein